MPDRDNDTRVELELATGDSISVLAAVADRVRGIDHDGDVIVCDPDMDSLIPVTPCCNATGKGTVTAASGVCCRRCHTEVGIKFGGPGTIAVPLRSPHPTGGSST